MGWGGRLSGVGHLCRAAKQLKTTHPREKVESLPWQP